MTTTIVNDRLYVWGRELIEDNTIEQADRTARLPIVYDHVALMPDAHVGFGSTIGSVIATRGAIIPAAVSVDIGCGCAATLTDLVASDLPDNLGPLHGAFVRDVPAGLGRWHADGTAGHVWIDAHPSSDRVLGDGTGLRDRAAVQFGTLGSGNHFLELCVDEADRVWVLLHSGSRGVGKALADIHIAVAASRFGDGDLEDPALAYLQESDPAFDAYVTAMLWAQDYADANRTAMIRRVIGTMRTVLDRPFTIRDVVNMHHNYCERERHGGIDVWVTRKGAVRARVGDRAVIPGSMATGSFIVSGLGNPASWMSCSHGAGRRLSRGAANRSLTADTLRSAMAGKAWNDRDADSLVDEHPDAYKDVWAVMGAQADLVRVDHTLTQVLNVKGTDGGRRRRKHG